MENAHPRPWHAGSLFDAGPRRPLSIGDRCLWLGKLSNALKGQQLSGKEFLVGRSLINLLGEDGRLDPSEAYLAERAMVSPSTVWRAKRRLEGLGLLRWQRRLTRAGWRTEQTSCAYELVPDGQPITPRLPPARAAGLLRRRCGLHVEGETHPLINSPLTSPQIRPSYLEGRKLAAFRAGLREVSPY
jgi:hypothetical protein